MKAFTEQSERQRGNTLVELEKRRKRQLDDSLKEIMASESGRKFMHWLIFEQCRMFGAVTDLAIKDGHCASLHSWLEDGRRQVGMDLLNYVQALAPAEQLLMVEEKIREQRSDLALGKDEPVAEEDADA